MLLLLDQAFPQINCFVGWTQAPGEGGTVQYLNVCWRFTRDSAQWQQTILYFRRVLNHISVRWVGEDLAALIRGLRSWSLNTAVQEVATALTGATSALRHAMRQAAGMQHATQVERQGVMEAALRASQQAQVLTTLSAQLLLQAAQPGGPPGPPASDSEVEDEADEAGGWL